MKSISTINPAIKENTDGTIVKARAPVIDVKVGVSPWHDVSLRFVSFPGLLMVGYHSAKNNVTSTPASTALT